MNNKTNKYLSRKFIITILGTISGIAEVISGLGGEIGTVAGVIVTGIILLSYVITEGVIDTKAISMTSDLIKEIETLRDKKESDNNG